MSTATPTRKAMRNQKISFSLPEELIGRLKNLTPAKRNLLVKLALEKELDREAAAAKLKTMRGKAIWKKKHHPDLLTPEDFAHYRSRKNLTF
jgi:hypothetical protein